MKKLLTAILFFSLSAMTLCHATEYGNEFKTLASKAAIQSQKYWQGKHFGEHPYADDAKIYDGRNTHDYTMLYWNLMDAKLNGNKESLNRALSHYRFTVEHFWDNEKKRFRTGYDFLSNTSIVMSILLSLRDARSVIPEEVRNDMISRVKAIADYLPTYTTALLNNRDLRANNQDSFAAFALAMASIELKDLQIRRDALEKFRSVLERAQQSFWIEGGVDVGYQSVGEPAYMAAADLLWDDLSREERLKVVNLQLSNTVGNGFGLENARSSSWITAAPAATFSSALLGRVPNEFIAADAEALFLKTARSGFPSKWWLHDPAALSFFSGFYKYMPQIAKINKRSDRFASGSLACHIMDRDEQSALFTGMEKAYLTGDNGTTAIFGDYSRLHPEQLLKKFGAARLPFTPNPGGLRYLGNERHLYIIPDDMLGAPRLFMNDRTRYPQLFHRASYPGAGASEYILTQILPGMNETPAATVRQSFAVIGDVLVSVFYAPEKPEGLSYGVTMPSTGFSQKGNTARIPQKALCDGKNRTLEITSFNIQKCELEPGRRAAFFKNELRVDGKNKKLPTLSAVQFQFGKEDTSALLFSPEGRAENIRFANRNGIFSVEFKANGVEYIVLCASVPVDRLEFKKTDRLPAFSVSSPRPGYLQTVGFVNGKLKSFAVNGKAFVLDGEEIFESGLNQTVSAEVFSDSVLLTCDGSISLGGKLGGTGYSFVDAQIRKLPASIPAERILIKK